MDGIENIKQVYLLGIGGIGMSALARYFHGSGRVVAGYDKTPTSLTAALEREGMVIHYEDSVALLPESFRDEKNKSETLVIYTPAVPREQQEYNYFLLGGYRVMKRSEVLGAITHDSFTIAVAGTHGKTTTSSMIAHLLRVAGIDCSAFLGGIAVNYNSNLLVSSAKTEQTVVVVEADEYDRSFLSLHPDISVITSMDADHLDIYGNKEYMEESYRLFASQTKESGRLICRKGLPLAPGQAGSVYSLDGAADYTASGIEIRDHRYHFTWNNSHSSISDLVSGMPGLHNIENAVAAIAVARMMGAQEEQIREGIQSYKGVRRRFEYQVNRPGLVYIDDYAHHPEELRACIESVRALYPGKKITGIFQPHLYTRTRDFAKEFALSLGLLDDLILLDIYPARERPIEGVDANLILGRVQLEHKVLCSKDRVLEELRNHRFDVLLTLGAGDIDTLVEPIRNQLTNK